MVNLEWVHQQLVMEIQQGLGAVASGADSAVLGATFEHLCRYLQALGICHLLEFADREEFRTNLARSAQCRQYYLRVAARKEHVADHRLAISRTEAFLDAVCAGDLSVARGIARLSPPDWIQEGEYEDDFCYYSFLHSLLLDRDDDSSRERTLDRFAIALEGGESPRLDVCRAILLKDVDGFSECFETLLQSIQNINDNRRQTVEDYNLVFWPRSFISVEGYALLRLAEIVGISVDGDFVLCPALGRLPSQSVPPMDIFAEIDRNIAGGGMV